jgi:uncharacterized protein YecT (DUF1311 family)
MPAIKHTFAPIVALLVASGSTIPAHVDAQQAAPGNISWPACRQSAMTTLEMNACAATGARAADERMNKSYDAVACHLGLDGKALLASAQRAWDAFRDANCAFWRGDGSTGLMNQLDCRTSLANARADELDRWPPNAPRDALIPCK